MIKEIIPGFTQFFPEETISVIMPYEMYNKKKLNTYWSKIKERADNYDKEVGEENAWRDIVVCYHFFRNVKGMYDWDAIDEVAKCYPWNNEEKDRLEEEQKEREEQHRYETDEDYRNDRDLKDAVFEILHKPLVFATAEDIEILKKLMPPKLSKPWTEYLKKIGK